MGEAEEAKPSLGMTCLGGGWLLCVRIGRVHGCKIRRRPSGSMLGARATSRLDARTSPEAE
ncbi:hypothetical protein CCHR01_17956 [Colletotrichum chrysophilum]|uniref:Uncharacterized protein n=1 Tax=Colletotrichum chrysophilum TaxID=1836956 RepID=A0AAD9EBZ7_9PEZI|nr:hypothetical protein CCHR01_17956 [Colletotrichum chrysophilum]